MKMNMKSRPVPPRLLAILLAALTILSFTACSAGKDISTPAEDSIPGQNSAAGVMDGGSKEEAATPGDIGAAYERKIIRTVTMSCETKAFDDALTLIMNTLGVCGGYVETSTVNGAGYEKSRSTAYEQGDSRRASLTLRVPAEKLDGFLEALRTDEGIRILSQTSTSDEVTAAYYDTKTRIDTLTAERDALMAMLAGFTDYKDISAMLDVQERLYDVIEEMEALQTKLKLYDNQVAMSTVTLHLAEVITFTVPADPTFGERISTTFRESWADFTDGCQNLAVFLVGAFPSLLVLAVLVGTVLCIVLVCARRGKKKQKSTTGSPADKTK